MDWQREGPGWPHHERSRLVVCHGQRWHLQHWPAPRPGAARWLLLHGTGASTHSWRSFAPLLAREAEVWALDLPGHGFSGPATWRHSDMPGMARAVLRLLHGQQIAIEGVLGHSAGAAIGIRMALLEPARVPLVVSLNGALLPLPGLAGIVFPPLSKLLAVNPLVPYLFAWRARQQRVLDRLLQSTGSRIDPAGRQLYARLVADPDHVAGALAMMSQWNLQALKDELPQLAVPLLLLVAERDGTVPPADAARVAALVPGARETRLPRLGHLAHEEDPAAVRAALAESGVLERAAALRAQEQTR